MSVDGTQPGSSGPSTAALAPATEPPPKYSIWKALRKEIGENPLRCTLAFAQTAALCVGAVFYVLNVISPEPSSVTIHEMVLTKRADGSSEGMLSFVPIGPDPT